MEVLSPKSVKKKIDEASYKLILTNYFKKLAAASIGSISARLFSRTADGNTKVPNYTITSKLNFCYEFCLFLIFHRQVKPLVEEM